jgi:ligand-binding SRPBCC domain-containing protein
MVRGAFAWMVHDHYFDAAPDGGTVLRDELRFAAPLGILGRIAERLVLRRYMTRFLQARNAVLKRAAESDEWREFLDETPGAPQG